MRIWDVTPRGHDMKEALKEHKGAVTCIKIRRNDEEVTISLQYSLACNLANTVHVIESVSRDGPDTPMYDIVMCYKICICTDLYKNPVLFPPSVSLLVRMEPVLSGI